MIDCWEDIEKALNEEKEKSDRHQYCGRKFNKINPKKLRELIKFTFICGDYRHCKWCLKEKAQQEMTIVGTGVYKHDTKLVITSLSTNNAKKLQRQLRDKDISYRSYPQPDDKITVLHCDESQPGEVISTADEFMDLPFEEWLQNVPQKRRISGRGYMQAKKVVKEKEKEGETIWSFALWTDAPSKEKDECWQQAVEETPGPYLNVEDCIKERMQTFKRILEDKKFVTYCVPQLIKIPAEEMTEQLEIPT